MNFWKLNAAYFRHQSTSMVVEVLLMALGIGLVIVLTIGMNQLKENVGVNARGIDLVVGAKGSPLQIVLSSLFHVDYPTGNFSLKEAVEIANNRYIANAIPLALGDGYRGTRIVGSTAALIDLYGGKPVHGTLPNKLHEAVLGYNVCKKFQLELGDNLVSQHGLEEGDAHSDDSYYIVGVLDPTGTVLDDLIVTNIETIWTVHQKDKSLSEHTNGLSDSATFNKKLNMHIPASLKDKEITSMLVRYRSPMGAVQLPRLINTRTTAQAASPAFEMARLYSLLGTGRTVAEGLGVVLILMASLGVFLGLYRKLNDYRYDIAVLRSMGGSKSLVFRWVVLQGAVIVVVGLILGVLMGHVAAELVGHFFINQGSVRLTGWVFFPEEWRVALFALILGLIISFFPAWKASRMEISGMLVNR